MVATGTVRAPSQGPGPHDGGPRSSRTLSVIAALSGVFRVVRKALSHAHLTSTPSRWKSAGPVRPGGPGNPGGPGQGGGANTGVITRTRAKTAKPSMYKVLLLNDDYTPMEFVVHVLERFFHKNHEEATQIMLHVHRKGVGICGVYPYEIAETKVTQVIDLARKHQHPLQCTLEKD